MKFELLRGVPIIETSDCDDNVYSLAAIRDRPGVVCKQVTKQCWLLTRLEENGVTLHFVAVEWYTESGGDTHVTALFGGNGPSGNLRELRHTYWGRDGDGYCFYLDVDNAVAALSALKEHFD